MNSLITIHHRMSPFLEGFTCIVLPKENGTPIHRGIGREGAFVISAIELA